MSTGSPSNSSNKDLTVAAGLIAVATLITYALIQTSLPYDLPYFISFVPPMVYLAIILTKANVGIALIIAIFGGIGSSIIFGSVAPLIYWGMILGSGIACSIVLHLLLKLQINKGILLVFLPVLAGEMVFLSIEWYFYFFYWHTDVVVYFLITYAIVQIGYWVSYRKFHS